MSSTSESEIRSEPGNSHEGDAQARSMADTVARRSYGKLVAFLTARTRDVAAAEDALSEAFASALTDWPRNGCPENPEAWLMTVARRKAIDVARKRFTGETVAGQLQILAEGLEAAAAERGEIPDRRLALLFACAHTAIDAAVRAPLMLQVVVGLEAKTIASAFLMSPAAMGKRLGRAKDKLRHGGIPFGIPEREELSSRLDSVSRRKRCAASRSDRRSYLSGESRYRTASRRTGSAGAAGVSASCRRSAERAAQCEWRIRSAGRAGFSVVGLGDDR